MSNKQPQYNYFPLYVTRTSDDNHEKVIHVRVFSQLGMMQPMLTGAKNNMNLKRWREIIAELSSDKKPMGFNDLSHTYLHHVYCSLAREYRDIFDAHFLGTLFFRCKTISFEGKKPRIYIRMATKNDIHIDDVKLELLPTEKSMRDFDGHMLEVCLDMIYEISGRRDVSIRTGDVVSRKASTFIEQSSDEE